MKSKGEYLVPKQFEPIIKGKTIASCEEYNNMKDWFVIHFTDGSEFRIEYDFIYGWEYHED